MAHFLVVFDRRLGEVLREEPYDDYHDALAERFRTEKQHGDDPDIEVVVLSAASAGDLRRTHARYFLTLSQLASAEHSATRTAAAG
jgi:hypothetical protein